MSMIDLLHLLDLQTLLQGNKVRARKSLKHVTLFVTRSGCIPGGLMVGAGLFNYGGGVGLWRQQKCPNCPRHFFVNKTVSSREVF